MSQSVWKTSASDFRKFVKYAKYFIDELRLGNWVVKFSHELCPECRLSQTHYWLSTKNALITLSTEWPTEPTAIHLSESAFHELLHIVMARLLNLAEDRYTTERDLHDEEHAVIQSICYSKFGPGLDSEWD